MEKALIGIHKGSVMIQIIVGCKFFCFLNKNSGMRFKIDTFSYDMLVFFEFESSHGAYIYTVEQAIWETVIGSICGSYLHYTLD